MDQNEQTLVREYLLQEIATNRTSIRRNLLIGGVLGVVLVAYCGFLLYMVSNFTNPKKLAEFVYTQSVLLMPQAKKDLVGSLNAAAPDVIRGVIEQIVTVFPQMRGFAEDELKKITNEATRTARAQLDEVYREVLVSAKAKVIEWDKAGQAPSSQIFLDELKKDIDAQITNRITAKPEESVFAKLDATYDQLTLIEKKLRRLTNDKNPTRSEVLEKRLIQSWMLLLEDAVVDVDSNDKGTVKTNLPKPEAAPEAKAAPAPAPAPAP